jgi:hypothetical protein
MPRSPGALQPPSFPFCLPHLSSNSSWQQERPRNCRRVARVMCCRQGRQGAVQQGEPDQGTHEPAPSARLASHYACAGQWAGSCPLQPAAQGAHLRQGFEPPAAQIQVQQRVQVRPSGMPDCVSGFSPSLSCSQGEWEGEERQAGRRAGLMSPGWVNCRRLRFAPGKRTCTQRGGRTNRGHQAGGGTQLQLCWGIGHTRSARPAGDAAMLLPSPGEAGLPRMTGWRAAHSLPAPDTAGP